MLQFGNAQKNFARHLREIRLTLQLSIKDTAELIGIYPARLSDYERCVHIPTTQTMNNIVRTFQSLGVSSETTDELMEIHENAINSSNNRVVGRIRREIS